ncbi:hypothetical protein KC330_g3097 [Hortaea werneckii]|nr:hypothetical protein KC330_g3097 [Hortaea werneckii]
MLLFLAILARSLLASSLSILEDYPIGNIASNHSTTQDEGRTSVAVIGAGLAGASVAFRAYEMFYPNSNLQLTINERESRFGERIHTIRPQNEFRAALKLGATNFYTNDDCLMQLLNYVGLHHIASRECQHLPFKRRWIKAQWQNQVPCDALDLSWPQFVKRLWSQRFTDFQEEIVRPCIRARLGKDLEEVHGLSALIAAGSSSTATVVGGNSRLIERLIKLSGARLSLSSEVIAIGRGEERRYKLTIRHGLKGSEEIEYVEFDSVVLAAPLQLLDIDLSGLGLDLNTASTANDFIEAHITHITSPFQLITNSSYPSINISMTNDDVLTSASPPGDMNLLKVQCTDVCYFPGCPPATGCDMCELEYLYRVHSQRALEDAELVDMLEIEYNDDVPLTEISWVRQDVWPRAFLPYRGRQDFSGKFELAPRLYYTGGGEEVMNSMEMSCKMGEQVAAKLVSNGSEL